ncbi:aquaporin [Hymenobacter glaciei]
MAFAAHLYQALRRNWRHYVVEAAGIMAFMTVSSLAAVLFLHSDSAVARAFGPKAWVQRSGVAVAVALLITGMANSPWGKRSGALFNPAVTLGFWQLGYIATADALWYALAQFSGACVAGVSLSWLLKPWFSHPTIHYNTTVPIEGKHGWALALGAETLISAALMLVLLWALHSPTRKRWAGALAGLALALFIVVEAPLSGMSLNPARTLGAAIGAGKAHGLWLYFLGPLAGAWATAALYQRYHRRQPTGEAAPPHFPDPKA